MKSLSAVIVCGGLLCASTAFASDTDMVFLRNGGRLQGVVVEEDPTTGATLRLADGTIRKVSRADISSIKYATDVAATSPAPLALAMPKLRRHASTDDGEDTQAIKPLWLTGLVTLAVVYPVTVGVTVGLAFGYQTREPGVPVAESAIPVVGPWVVLAANPQLSSAASFGYAFSGVMQGLGLTAIILGGTLRMPKHHRREVIEDAAIVPWMPSSTGGGGVSVIGKF